MTAPRALFLCLEGGGHAECRGIGQRYGSGDVGCVAIDLAE